MFSCAPEYAEGHVAICTRLSSRQLAADATVAPGGRSVRPLADTSIGHRVREYRRARGVGRAIVRVPEKGSLLRLVASGTAFTWIRCGR